MAVGVSGLLGLPLGYDLLDRHHSYFKFNLDTINLYSLLRFETKDSPFRSAYLNAYNLLRRTTDDHRNAHFNMVDRAIKGANAKRDQETIDFLQEWMDRPRPIRSSISEALSPLLATIRHATSFPFHAVPPPIFCGSEVRSFFMAAARGLSKDPESISCFPIGWRAFSPSSNC